MKSCTNIEIENNYFVNVHVYVFMNERRRRTKVGYALLIKLCSFIFHWSHLVLSLKGTFYSMNIIKWFNFMCFYLKEEQCKGSPRMLQSCKVYQGNHFCKVCNLIYTWMHVFCIEWRSQSCCLCRNNYTYSSKKKWLSILWLEMRPLLLQNNVENNLRKIDMIILFLSSRKLHQSM